MTDRVPMLSIAFLVVSTLVAIGLPVLVILHARKKWRVPPVSVVLGLGGYFLFTVFLETNLMALMLRVPGVSEWIYSSAFSLAGYIAFLSALFEESGRLAVFYFLLRKPQYDTVEGALGYGTGHFALESSLLISTTIGYLALSYSINTQGVNAAVSSLLQTTGIDMSSVAEGLIEASPWVYLIYGLERVCALAFHIGASVLVWLAASGRASFGAYFIALGLHIAYVFPSGLYLHGIFTSMWLVLLAAAIVSVATYCVAARLYRKAAGNKLHLL